MQWSGWLKRSNGDEWWAPVSQAAKSQPLPANGKFGNGRSFDNVTATDGGNSQAYLLRRIARDNPELLDQIGPGNTRSSTSSAA